MVIQIQMLFKYDQDKNLRLTLTMALINAGPKKVARADGTSQLNGS